MAETDRGARLLAWAHRRPERIRGRNPWAFTACLWRQIVDDRVAGLAAEMAFFALLSFVPLLVAVGAALGFAERFVDAEQIARGQEAVIRGLQFVFSTEVTAEVIAPVVRGLLTQERTGLALGSLVVTLYLASRVFTATIRALDLAYNVEERRGLLAQRGLALLFALGAVIAVTATLVLMVIGPLLGGGQALADRLGLGRAFELAWEVGRWPVLAGIVVGFFTLVYRYGPGIKHPWRHCLPGAVLGVVLWVLVSLGFRVYLQTGGPQMPQFGGEEEALAMAGRAIGTLVAAVLWIYLSSVVLLVGGEFNAELAGTRVEGRRGARQPGSA